MRSGVWSWTTGATDVKAPAPKKRGPRGNADKKARMQKASPLKGDKLHAQTCTCTQLARAHIDVHLNWTLFRSPCDGACRLPPALRHNRGGGATFGSQLSPWLPCSHGRPYRALIKHWATNRWQPCIATRGNAYVSHCNRTCVAKTRCTLTHSAPRCWTKSSPRNFQSQMQPQQQHVK